MTHGRLQTGRNLGVQSQQWYEVDCDMQMEDQWKGTGGVVPNEYLLVPFGDSKA